MIDSTSITLVGAFLASFYIAIKYYRLYKKYKPYKKQYYDAINPPQIQTSLKGKKTSLTRKTYEVIRSQTLLKDHFRCQECNYYKHLEVHHIIPRSKGGTDDPSNLITLCGRCHAKKHGFIRRENKRRRHTERNKRRKLKKYLKHHKKEF